MIAAGEWSVFAFANEVAEVFSVARNEHLLSGQLTLGVHLILNYDFSDYIAHLVFFEKAQFCPTKPFFSLSGRQTRVAASEVSWRNASVLLARRNMKETLNQDTEPHESYQQLS